MSQSPLQQSSYGDSGTRVVGCIFLGVVVLGISGYLIATGVHEIQSQTAVITHKHAPSEHVVGDRARNEGIKNVILGGVFLLVGGFGVMRQISKQWHPPVSDSDNTPSGG